MPGPRGQRAMAISYACCSSPFQPLPPKKRFEPTPAHPTVGSNGALWPQSSWGWELEGGAVPASLPFPRRSRQTGPGGSSRTAELK